MVFPGMISPKQNPKYCSDNHDVQPVRQVGRDKHDVESRHEDSKRERNKNNKVLPSDGASVRNVTFGAHGSNETQDQRSRAQCGL
jgi:hypothetical protein